MPQIKKEEKTPPGMRQFRQVLYDLKGDKSITEFANELGFSRSTVDSVLKGRLEPNLKILYQISETSPYSVMELIQLIYGMKDVKDAPKTATDAFGYVNVLDDSELKNLLELIFEYRKFEKIVFPVLVARSPEEKNQIITHLFKSLPEPIQKEFLTVWITTFLTF